MKAGIPISHSICIISNFNLEKTFANLQCTGIANPPFGVSMINSSVHRIKGGNSLKSLHVWTIANLSHSKTARVIQAVNTIIVLIIEFQCSKIKNRATPKNKDYIEQPFWFQVKKSTLTTAPKRNVNNTKLHISNSTFIHIIIMNGADG